MKKHIKIEISVAVALIFSLIASTVSFAAKCDTVRDDVVRLHILANSDSQADQSVKLLVRDALLESGNEIFSGTVTVQQAKRCLEKNAYKLIATAEKVLKENGFDYGASVTLTTEYFPTREYENFTLPAGEYLAVRVLLGEGKGHNWWCVMFPPLCLPAASEKTELETVFGVDGAAIVKTQAKYEIRFKIVEIIERIKEKTSLF